MVGRGEAATPLLKLILGNGHPFRAVTPTPRRQYLITLTFRVPRDTRILELAMRNVPHCPAKHEPQRICARSVDEGNHQVSQA
jgi:hypothetical protein